MAVGEAEVCYTGAVEALEDPAYRETVSAILRLGGRRSVFALVRDVRGLVPHVDVVVVRRDGVAFAARVLTGHLPPERLVGEARHVARQAARLARDPEAWGECCEGYRATHLVPVVVLRRGAPRLVEGVLVRPLEAAIRLFEDPSPALSDPAVRVYRVEWG